ELERDGAFLTGYTGPATVNFEMLDAVDIRFNRLILYRGNVLHCALFDGARLESDPRTGRLTANSFVRPR
ncbi:MAG: histone acetyltransferase, partial [Asticcacaulis sp.]|nr:histone acetyltransferase [Asticcacaulis sp.]